MEFCKRKSISLRLVKPLQDFSRRAHAEMPTFSALTQVFSNPFCLVAATYLSFFYLNFLFPPLAPAYFNPGCPFIPNLLSALIWKDPPSCSEIHFRLLEPGCFLYWEEVKENALSGALPEKGCCIVRLIKLHLVGISWWVFPTGEFYLDARWRFTMFWGDTSLAL